MRLAVLVLALSTSSVAQTHFDGEPGLFLSVEQFDVLGGDGQTHVDAALGWRFAEGSDVGLSVDAGEIREVDSHVEVRLQAGHTWRPAARVGVRVKASAGYAWRSAVLGSRTESLDGGVTDLATTAFYQLPVVGSVDVRPTLGVFYVVQGADTAWVRAYGLGPAGDLRNAAGMEVGLPVTFRVLGSGLAVSPTVRVGMGLDDHAFWSDGGMRLHVNL